MVQTIPASQISKVTPGVLASSGGSNTLTPLMLSNSVRVPIGTVMSFADQPDVAAFFGDASVEANAATVLFQGFDNAQTTPDELLIVQYPWSSAVSAYLWGGNISGLSLTQLQALAGTLTITSNGTALTSSAIALTDATSFSNAATIILAGFTDPAFTVTYDSVTGAFVVISTTTGTGSTMAFAEEVDATATACTSAGTVLTIGGTVAGTFLIGDIVSGTDTTNSLPAGCTLVNQLSGSTGKAGTYTISAAATPGNLTSCAVTGRGTTGFAASLLLTQATEAYLSQGAPIAVPATNMAEIVAITKAFFQFYSGFEPSVDDKTAFAAWTSSEDDLYCYINATTEIAVTLSGDTTSSVFQINQAGDSGTASVYQPSNLYTGAMLAGWIASVDYGQVNGRATFANRTQAGMTPGVSNGTTAQNLLANGCNFYGLYANASNQWQRFKNGSVSGDFNWLDSYAGQAWLNSALQTATIDYLGSARTIPYNTAGNTGIREALTGIGSPVAQGLQNGVIVAGSQLDGVQIQAINNQTGVNAAQSVMTLGWYLYIGPVAGSVRVARGSPPITLYYSDGESIQTINLNSIDVQ